VDQHVPVSTPEQSVSEADAKRLHAPPPHEAPPHYDPLQVTIREAGRLLSYNDRTIRRLILMGELSALGQGSLRRVTMQSIRDYQQRHLTTRR
jgi:excisionase family DNA binding protein